MKTCWPPGPSQPLVHMSPASSLMQSPDYKRDYQPEIASAGERAAGLLFYFQCLHFKEEHELDDKSSQDDYKYKELF